MHTGAGLSLLKGLRVRAGTRGWHPTLLGDLTRPQAVPPPSSGKSGDVLPRRKVRPPTQPPSWGSHQQECRQQVPCGPRTLWGWKDRRSHPPASCQMQPSRVRRQEAIPSVNGSLGRGDPTTLSVKVLFPQQAGFYLSYTAHDFPWLDKPVPVLSATVLLALVVLRGKHSLVV